MSDQFQPYEPGPPAARPASALAAIVLLLFVFVVGVAVGQAGSLVRPTAPEPTQAPASGLPSPDASPAAQEGFELFWEALDVIRQNFVGRDEIVSRDLTYGAIRGLVEALGDTGHSVFLTPEEVRSEQDALNNNVIGIGVLVAKRGDRAIVASVISGSPAQGAGLKAGDEFVAVDGQSVTGLEPEQVAARVRGEEGMAVVVTMDRPSTGERLDFDIVRRRIRFPAASWAMVPGTDIAMLRLVQFSSGSAAELKSARDQALAAGAQSFILDLRGNPGGFVHEAVDVASLFLDDGVVYIRETSAGERIPVDVNPNTEPTALPLVVLIDRNSASSAEIVAGAIASAGRATLIGETTFGTGTVLLSFNLGDGSAIRLAVERWLTPDEELIFGRGIEPTIALSLADDQAPVEPDQLRDLTAAQLELLEDAQLRAAIDLLLGR
ncbi:S41 family peptidase [soil metagenome]